MQGVALRSMKAPGTAYNDKVLSKDPQPAHMNNYVNTTMDNGGVHINSGIPNHAFYLAAIALGGFAWRRPRYLVCHHMRFAPFSERAVSGLRQPHSGECRQALWRGGTAGCYQCMAAGWDQCDPAIDEYRTWTLHDSWGPTNNYAAVNLVFNSNGTFSGGATGKWSQQDGTLLLSFELRPGEICRHAGRQYRYRRHVNVQRARRLLVSFETGHGRHCA